MDNHAQSEKPCATMQVDVDSVWAMAENAGRKGVPEESNVVYKKGLPKFFEFFAEAGIKATFFIVGKDLEVRANRELVRRLVCEGHEVANHSLSHISQVPFSELSLKQRRREIMAAHDRISDVAGVSPVGFKTPAYAALTQDDKIFLRDNGYRYYAGTMALSVAPLLRMYQWMRVHNAGRSYWQCAPDTGGVEGLAHVPVSTVPYVSLPFHSSFVFLFGMPWFYVGEFLSRKSRKPLHYSFHGIDMIGKDEVSRSLGGMINAARTADEKKSVLQNVLTVVSKNYHVVRTVDFVRSMQERSCAREDVYEGSV